MESDSLALAVDVGGTKMAACLVQSDGRLIGSQTIPTADGSAEDVWQPLATLVREIAARADRPLLGVGVGTAGPLDLAGGTVSPVNIAGWREFPLARRLAEVLPGVPVRMAGDGICAAVGEHWRGAAREVDDVIVLVVSTGVGGGIIQRGRLVTGRTGNAGHIGHTVVDLGGDPCPCGGRGCVEALASGPSMVSYAVRNGWVGSSAVELADAARAGDKVANQAFERAGHAVAAGIISASALCDLTAAVIGGGVSHAADLLFPPLKRALEEHGKLGFLRDIEISTAALGSSAGLVGAGALVFEPERYPSAARLVHV
ncbi:ROK family protein [Hamadaea tsunoensis]|uniref:ROK family protein n=1 Tax=Hamadaea tsunoensis TaxID=53368 RepID=UPI000425CF2D|nr:ROK family protein [Hamadaea tsunoensis]